MDHQATLDNPPPYKSSSANQEDAPDDLLEPGLKFDSETVLSNLHKSDQAFAREVVGLIARRAQDGIFSTHSWGYSFTELSESEKQTTHLKKSGWDCRIGFNAYSYRKRYHIVAELAQEDLKKRGIFTESLNLFVSEKGIYVSWELVIPTVKV